MRPRLIVIAPLIAIASAANAQTDDDYISADRPGFAESSEVVGRGRVQLETGVQRETRKAGEDPERNVFLPTLLRWGVTENWEARFESDLYAWMRQSDGARAEALAPASVGFKYQFMEAEQGRPSVGAIVRISPASGSKVLRTRRTTGDIRLAADWDFRPQWSLNPNIGLAIEEDEEGRRFSATLLAATLAYKPRRTLEVFLDSALQRPEARGGRSSLVYDAGMAYLVARDVQLDISAGARGRGTNPPRSFVGAGVSVRF